MNSFKNLIKKVIRDRANYQKVKASYNELKSDSLNYNPRFDFDWKGRKLVFDEDTPGTYYDRHYVYHPAWAARILASTKPDFHVDISSTLNFCSTVSAFIPVKFYDYRPADIQLDGLTSAAEDLTKLSFNDESIHSLSCMHTVEHIGLGRYGDPIDYEGDLKAVNELSRVLAPKGNLLFVVPVGHISKIMFNAHRIYNAESVIKAFKNLKLVEFTLIPQDAEDGGLVINPSKDLLERQTYGCGCFWFTKE